VSKENWNYIGLVLLLLSAVGGATIWLAVPGGKELFEYCIRNPRYGGSLVRECLEHLGYLIVETRFGFWLAIALAMAVAFLFGKGWVKGARRLEELEEKSSL
jgi:hypothetical protein